MSDDVLVMGMTGIRQSQIYQIGSKLDLIVQKKLAKSKRFLKSGQYILILNPN